MITGIPTQPPDLLLESVLQNSLDGILLCRAIRDRDGHIVDFHVIRCNDKAAFMVGRSREQILNQTMLTLDPDGIKSGIFEKYSRVTDTGLPMYIEHYFAGGDVWMAQSLAKFDDGVLASWSDISELKAVERTRERERELLEAILDNTQTGIAVMQSVHNGAGRVVDFRFTHINADAERITQRSKEDLVGQLYSVAWPQAKTNGVLDWHIAVAETGKPAKINGVNIPVNEYDGWYNIRIRPFGNGVIATFVNITALKQAELANQQQADLLRSVLDSSSNAIIALKAVRDTQGKITDFEYVTQNEASRRKPVRTDEEVIGHTMLELFPHVMLTGLFDRYVEVVETGKPARFEQEYNYDQLTGWFELSVVKWGDGIVLTLVDINDSKKHQQHMEQTNRELLHVNDNLRQFAYVASHDLQEPLRKIIAFGDMLEEQFGSNLGEAGHDIIKRMQIATKRMSALIKDVLAYSRITTHREPFRLIALNDLVEHIKVEFQEEFRDVDTYLEVEELPVVRGDRSQIHQLFSNLLANALKFRPEDRSPVIRISCRSIVGDEGPSELRPNVTYHEITVSDNGIGFDRKHTERIFQVFNDSITDSNTKARALA